MSAPVGGRDWRWLWWIVGLVAILGICAYSSDHRVSQFYWYCWDSGAPAPHHLGYIVNGDHYCTDGELRRSGYHEVSSGVWTQ